MAECVSFDLNVNDIDWSKHMYNFNEQELEILSLKSFYENTDCIEILKKANSNDCHKLNSLRFKIRISTNGLKRPFKLEILIPQEDALHTQVNLGSERKELERTLSGHHSSIDLKCDYLPPVYLNVVLPQSYPSDSCPLFALSSFWLNHSQLTDICHELDILWCSNKPMIIIYTWIEWIQENLVDYLGLKINDDSILLRPINNFAKETLDSRATSEFVDIQSCIYQILSFNFSEEQNEFSKSVQICSLCYEEKLGKDFLRLHKCKHSFCAVCVGEYAKIYVNEGTVQLLKCPEKDCDEKLGDDVMKCVLTHDEYDRWDRLTLQMALDSMQDVSYCPQCSYPVITENNGTQFFCTNCKSDYCKECKEKWHIKECCLLKGSCQTLEEKAAHAVKKLNVNAQDFLQMTDEEIVKQFHKNSDNLLILRRKLEEKQTTDSLLGSFSKYRRCPVCKCLIEKYEGCNKVSCRCGTIMCYVCGRKIDGYDHFGDGNCNLWSNMSSVENRVPVREVHPAQQAINRVLNIIPEQQENLARCPSCGQNCLKVNRNNHLKCWLCQTNFCFMCKQRIQGIITNHFKGATSCKQHS